MPFFKELRRRTTGTKADKSSSITHSNGTDDSQQSNGTMPTTKSSSTLNSLYGSSTPASSIKPHQSTPTLVTSKSASAATPTSTSLPQRPMPRGSSNRNSFMVRERPCDVTTYCFESNGSTWDDSLSFLVGSQCTICERIHYVQNTNFTFCPSNIDSLR